VQGILAKKHSRVCAEGRDTQEGEPDYTKITGCNTNAKEKEVKITSSPPLSREFDDQLSLVIPLIFGFQIR
jgi:hypothetical protein